MADIKMYSLKDVREIMDVTQRTMYNYLRDGKLKAVKIGKYYRVSEENLRAFLDQNKASDKEKQLMKYLDQGESSVSFYAHDLRSFGIDVSTEELKSLLTALCDRRTEIETDNSYMLLSILNGFMLDHGEGDLFKVSVNPEAVRLAVQDNNKE